MLSVIILCAPAPANGRAAAPAEAVVRTLSSLVGASVRGLVRDVILAGPRESDLGLIADHAGCVFVEGASEAECLRFALARVRGEDLLVLLPGHVPESGFVEEVEDLLSRGDLRDGRRIRAAPVNYWQHLMPALAPIVGFIASVNACRAMSEAANLSFDALVRATNSRRTLRARAHRIG
jgi:hypothetical protein